MNTATATDNRPLASALSSLRDALTVAEQAYDAADCSDACAADPGDRHQDCCPVRPLIDARSASRDAYRNALSAWRESDEERTYRISDDQCSWKISSSPGALEDDLRTGADDVDRDHTTHAYEILSSVALFPWGDPDEGQADRRTFSFAPEEPGCSDNAPDDDHDWAPLGGPWGAGAGIAVSYVCRWCQVRRNERTHYQISSTGEDVGDRTEYVYGDDDAIAYVQRGRDRAAKIGAEDGESDAEAHPEIGSGYDWIKAAINAGAAEARQILEPYQGAYHEAYQEAAERIASSRDPE
jgi:hypothetical protein